MQQVLVSDTSVLIDFKRGSLLEASFRLAFRFVVPDLLYERELKNWGGEDLMRLGLVVEALDGEGCHTDTLALAYRKRMPALSLPDCFALALAQKSVQQWILLSGDGVLSRLATDEAVECHGVRLASRQDDDAAVVSIRELYDGLTAISQHPRCRLPKPRNPNRLAHYAGRLR